MATYAGIDIAKHAFDLATEPKHRTRRFDNDAKGIASACKILRQLGEILKADARLLAGQIVIVDGETSQRR